VGKLGNDIMDPTTEIAATAVPDAPVATEGFDEYVAEVRHAPMTWPLSREAPVGHRREEFSAGVRAELEYAMNMRQLGQKYLATYPTVKAEAVLWRLVAAVALAVAIAVSGMLLTVVALTGAALRPNPYLAVTVFVVGLSLSATVATAIHGERPRLRRR